MLSSARKCCRLRRQYWRFRERCNNKKKKKKQEGHHGPVSLHWLIHEIPSYQALQYLGIGLKHRPLTRTKIGSHSSYVKHQEDFERLHHMKACKTLKPLAINSTLGL